MSYTIALIEDDLAVLESLQMIFSLWSEMGCLTLKKLYSYTSLQPFLRERKKVDFDLLISDVFLKQGENSMHLLEKMRKEEDNLPTILMSGHVDQRMLVKVKQYQHTEFFAKPFDLEIMLASIKRFVACNA